MALLHDLGLDKTAKILGLKRRWLGLELDKSLARRVVEEMVKQNPIVSFFEGLEKAFAPPPPRVCIREEYTEAKSCERREGGSLWLVAWEFTYSDGTTESVSRFEVRV